MRIIYASDSLLPGKTANAIHVMKMCRALAQNGHTVTLIARKSPQYFRDLDAVYRQYAVEPLFDIHFSPCPNRKGSGFVYTKEALRFIREYNPELVYGRSLYICGFTALLLRKPVIFEIHGETAKNSKFGLVFKCLLHSKRLKRIVVISESLSRYYQREWKVPKERIIVAHDGADLNITQPAETSVVLQNSVPGHDLGYFGSLYKGKGMELISALAPQMPDYRFHVFGGRESEVDTWKKRTDGLRNIIYYGFVPQTAVAACARQMDVLLAPYQTNIYTSMDKKSEDIGKYLSPLKLFEYMSFEKPIVCTDLPVIREILMHGEDALLCAPNEPAQWIAAIESLCSDAALSKRLTDHARRKLERDYTWEKRAKKVLEFGLQ